MRIYRTLMKMATTTSLYYLTPNKTNVHFTSIGNPTGSLVIFLHGLGYSTEQFKTLLPAFPPKYRLISVDIEGFGKTVLASADTQLSFPRYVSNLHYLITHLQESGTGNANDQSGSISTTTSAKALDKKERKVILVGHSLGSIISLHYAAKYPSAVSGMLLLGVGRSISGNPQMQERLKGLAQMVRAKGMAAAASIIVPSNFSDKMENDKAHVRQLMDAVSSSDAESYARTGETVASSEHHDPDYGVIKCPVILVAGEHDALSPPQRSMDVSELLGGKTDVRVVNAGHQMIMQDLKGVEEAVSALLEEGDDGSV